MEDIYNELIKKINKERVLKDEPMSKHTTFRIGGKADIFVRIETVEELKTVISFANIKNIPITVIGNGSNCLVLDEGIRGITIKLDLKKIECIDDVTIEAEAGALIAKLSHMAADKGLTGLEFACGIPGTVGGAIRMNAGAHGNEISNILVNTTYLDSNLELHTITNEENEFGYRLSRFTKNKREIIISAQFKLEYGNIEKIKKKIQENTETRKEKQPIEYPSAGSVFKRGENFIAAKLIDEAGLKGLKIGDAEVSTKHAGFIINRGNAKAEDVIKLIEIIKQKVYEKFNTKIELEIEVIGEK